MLNVSLFANHRLLLSDLGYTHTHLRPYTAGTPQHNTVVVDMKTQEIPRSGGRLFFAELQNPVCKIVDMDAPKAYHQLKEYARCDFLVSVGDTGYVADFFTVAGAAKTLDLFFHGDAWNEDEVTMSANGKPLAFVKDDLLPKQTRATWKPATQESQFALMRTPMYNYGYFSDIASATWNCRKTTLTADFTNPDGSLLRFIFPPHPKLNLKPYIGHGPSLNRVPKEPNSIGKYFRRFICLRHTGEMPSKAQFNCIIQFQPDLVKNVRMHTDNVMEVTLDGRTDLIFRNRRKPAQFNVAGALIGVQGDYGFVSLDSTGAISNAYVAAGTITLNGKSVVAAPSKQIAKIRSADAEYYLELEKEVNIPTGAFVKILFPEQKETRGNIVTACNGRTITLKERTGLTHSSKTGWKWDSFPRTSLPGELFLEYTPVNHLQAAAMP